MLMGGDEVPSLRGCYITADCIMTVGVGPTFACVTSFLWDLQLLVSAADWTEKLEPDFIASHQHLVLPRTQL
jgi:hypothetical protein